MSSLAGVATTLLLLISWESKQKFLAQSRVGRSSVAYGPVAAPTGLEARTVASLPIGPIVTNNPDWQLPNWPNTCAWIVRSGLQYRGPRRLPGPAGRRELVRSTSCRSVFFMARGSLGAPALCGARVEGLPNTCGPSNRTRSLAPNCGAGARYTWVAGSCSRVRVYGHALTRATFPGWSAGRRARAASRRSR